MPISFEDPFSFELPLEASPFEPDTEENMTFFTESQNARQRRAFRGAKTEVRRSSRQLKRALGEEVYKSETDPGFWHGMMTLTDPLFDLLQIGQFTTAGAALAYHEEGVGFEALRRAGSEFLNALPGIDEKRAEEITGVAPTRASFTDLLRETEALDVTGNERMDEWLSAAGGFILDVVLDPVTYAGGLGLVKVLPKAGAARGIGYKLSPLASKVIQNTTGQTVSDVSLPFVSKGSAKTIEGIRDRGAEEAFGFKTFGKVREQLGETFIAGHGVKEYGRRTDTDVSGFLSAKGQVDRDIHAGMVNIKDLATELAGNLTPAERSLLMIFKDQPQKWKEVLEKVAAGNPSKAKKLDEKYKAFTSAFEKHFEEEVEAGLMSPSALRQHYAPGRYPNTGTGWKAFQDTMKHLKLDSKRVNTEYSEYLRRAKLADEVSHIFQKGKKYSTLEERILAASPTEMDIVNAYVQRSIESVRAISTRKFTTAILDDPNIAHLIKDQSILKTLKKGGEGRSLDDIIKEFGEVEGRALYNEAEDFRKSIRGSGFGVWRPLKKIFSEIPKDKKGKAVVKAGSLFRDGDDEFRVLLKKKLRKKDASESLIEAANKKDNLLVENITTKEQFAIPKGTLAESRELIENPAYLLPMPFIKELNLADGIMKNNTEGNKFWKFLLNAQNIWKGWAIFSPGFHGRNHMSNVWNNWLGGVRNPNDYISAMRIQFADDFHLRDTMKKMGHSYEGKSVSVTMKEMKKVGGKDKAVDVIYEGRDIAHLAREHGVLGKNLFIQEIATDDMNLLLKTLYKSRGKRKTFKKSKEELAEAVKDDKVAEAVVKSVPEKLDREQHEVLKRVFGVNNPALQFNRWMGSVIEDNAKLAHFLNRLKKGDSAEAASMSVKRYMFDYGELTTREREIMKAVIPFYTWMRKNIPLQISAVLEHPARYSRMTAKPIQAIEQLSEEWEGLETPDYFAEIHAVRMPKEVARRMQTWNKSFDDLLGENGVGSEQAEMGFQPVYLNPNFPFQDLNRLNWKSLLESMSPFIKTISGQMTGARGYSLFLDREIERYPGEPADAGILPGVDYNLRKKYEDILRSNIPPYGKVQRMREAFAKGKPAPQLISEFIGVKPLQTDVRKVRRGKVYNQRELLRNLKKKYRDLGIIP